MCGAFKQIILNYDAKAVVYCRVLPATCDVAHIFERVIRPNERVVVVVLGDGDVSKSRCRRSIFNFRPFSTHFVETRLRPNVQVECLVGRVRLYA